MGTEQGCVIPLKRNLGRNVGIVLGRELFVKDILGKNDEAHHGPIYTISQHRKTTDMFLTVGDWSAKIWSEEVTSPIYSTT